ncbi:hypothetical protein [Cyanobium sp. CH-040]|uniref:hypothetical protein n=1 Tax=Cyanobium sp. CH-040 TaxID=2823708 RepID=UPI0020CDAAC6|nr:hypothetical protein [Cyanobium sp. CH-040]MCP9927876.1 hypothetical protein [Cyanobium sp. CH-040]
MSSRLPPLRLVLLVALAGWASLLALESWWRLPAAGPEQGLPERLVLDGRPYRRFSGVQAPLPPKRALPIGLVLLEAADYRPAPASGDGAADGTADGAAAVLQLRRVVHARTGNSGVMPVRAITRALAGSDGQGRCVRLDADGRVQNTPAESAASAAPTAPESPGGVERLIWLAGLRPYRVNTCLWLGSPQSDGHPAGAGAAAAPPAG